MFYKDNYLSYEDIYNFFKRYNREEMIKMLNNYSTRPVIDTISSGDIFIYNNNKYVVIYFNKTNVYCKAYGNDYLERFDIDRFFKMINDPIVCPRYISSKAAKAKSEKDTIEEINREMKITYLYNAYKSNFNDYRKISSANDRLEKHIEEEIQIFAKNKEDIKITSNKLETAKKEFLDYMSEIGFEYNDEYKCFINDNGDKIYRTMD